MDMKNLIKKIKKTGAKRILLQVPEGLKTYALDMLVATIEKYGISVMLSAEPCYGACDLRDREAKLLGCELLVHLGHSDMGLKTRVPTIYDEYRMKFNPVPVLRKNITALKPYKKICLVTTLQFIDSLKSAKKFLESAAGGRKKIFIGNPLKAKYPGQVLGCDFSAAEPFSNMAECFLFMGSGSFHPIGLAMKVEKPVMFLDIEARKIRSMAEDKRKQEIIRAANIHKARECRGFGVLVSTKQGQMQIRTAEAVRDKLRKKGKNVWIIVMDEISPGKLMGLKLDCLVNCACPRLTDDVGQFKKPILNPEDVEKL